VTERLRTALSSLAAREVPADPAAVVARAGLLRRRRMAFAGAGAVSLAAVLGVAVAIASTTPDRAGFVAQLTPTPDVTSEEPTPSQSPYSSPSPMAAPTTTAPPTVAPTTAAPEPSGTYAPPGARVTVTASPGARTGEPVTFTIRVTDTDGWWNGGSVDYGDGTRAESFPAVASCVHEETPPPPDYTPHPSDQSKTFRHLYRKAGTYTVTAEARTQTGFCSFGGPSETVRATVTVTVTGEDLATNGPAEPSVTLTREPDDGPRTMVKIEIDDPDGYVAWYRIDWGDGTRAETRDGAAGCVYSPDNGYPTDGHVEGVEWHEYAEPGTYAVTVTATTAGCEGADQQTATGTLEVVVP
jgi:hypothetical protein